MSVVVFFETSSYSEVVAKFSSEEIYNACLPMLKNIAKKDGFIVTESVIKPEPMKKDLTYITIPVYHSEIDKKIIIDRELMIRECEAQIDVIELKLKENQ